MYCVSLRLGYDPIRVARLTLLSRMPSLALIALFCKFEVSLPFDGEDMSVSISDTFVVPFVFRWSKSVSVLGSSTRGAADIASVDAVERAGAN